MARRGAPALQGTASRGACHRAVRVRGSVGVRSARGAATRQLLPVGVVCHYALLGSAFEEGAAFSLALLLVVRPRGLFCPAVFHTAPAPRHWNGDARFGNGCSLYRPLAIQGLPPLKVFAAAFGGASSA